MEVSYIKVEKTKLTYYLDTSERYRLFIKEGFNKCFVYLNTF